MYMTKLTTVLAALTVSAAAFADEPIITATTSLYELAGPQNHFTLMLGATEKTSVEVDCGSGRVKYDIEPTGDISEGYVQGTPISCTVTSDATVKIYGDASKIDYFFGEGCYLRTLDIAKCTNMTIFNVNHNELTALDLSGHRNLMAVYVSDNPFNVSPFVLGSDHPELMILEMAMVGNLTPDFNINTYPQLASFDAYATYGLRQLDPTNCPKLMHISIEGAAVSSLDVTKNPNLLVLSISDTRIETIDLSKNQYLAEFYGAHDSGILNTDIKLKGIDTSKNPDLQRLAVNGNNLTTIDVSKNPKLIYLNVNRNRLTTIDVSACTRMDELDIMTNDMSFATMPLPRFQTYMYKQRPVQLDKSYKSGTSIDLSGKVLRDGTVTTAKLYGFNEAANASVELDESYYTYADGIITLKKTYADSLYVQYSNDVFVDYPMTTTKFMVKNESDFGKPSRIISFGTTLDGGRTFSMAVGMAGASATAAKTYYVDCGDGNMQQFSCTADDEQKWVTMSRTGSGNVNIYMPENETLTGFGVRDIPVTSVDLAAATHMTWLSITDASLAAIETPMNRALRSLDLSGNDLTTLNLSGVNSSYGKNELSRIDLSDNKLATLTLNDSRAIRHLDLSHNRLTAFDLKDFDNISSFAIADNQLGSINISYMVNCLSFDLSGNNLTEIQLPENFHKDMSKFDISGNRFTLADMPDVFTSRPTFVYAPQQRLEVPSKGPGLDLSAQNRFGKTIYSVLNADTDQPLTLGTDYTEEGGRIRFLAPAVGKKTYCRMTNSSFPQFNEADNSLKTNVMEAAGFPTNCIAEFTTPVGGQTVALSFAAAEAEGTALYIDWKGEGKDVDQYILGDTYRLFEAKTVAGAHVKVYTYSPQEHITVFAITGATMTDPDFSKLTDAFAITIQAAGISSIKLPADKSIIRELSLDGNSFTEFAPSQFPSLVTLSLMSNRLTTLDMSQNPSLEVFSATHNKLTSIKLDNPELWHLNLGENQLSDIDLSKLPKLENLGLQGNKFESMDVSKLYRLKQLVVDRNMMTFTTLPPVKSTYLEYIYSNQANLRAVCTDGVVDLSSQKAVGSTATEYRWFLGEPIVNDEGVLEGEELIVNDEYSVKDGVTTFHTALEKVQCVMTNADFPKLFLRSDLLNVTAGIEDVTAGTGKLDVTVTVDGGTVTVAADVADGTPASIYTLDGRMTASATFVGGRAVMSGVPAGVAVLTAGNTATKIVVK